MGGYKNPQQNNHSDYSESSSSSDENESNQKKQNLNNKNKLDDSGNKENIDKNISQDNLIEKKESILIIDDWTKEYIVQKYDTLMGISIQFNLSLEKIKNVNNISGEFLYPGQIIRLPKDSDSVNEKKEEPTIQKEDPQYSRASLFSLNFNQENNKKQSSVLYHAFYCTNYGEYFGSLQINDNFIMFDPQLNDPKIKNLHKNKISQFQAMIDMEDVNEIMMIGLPSCVDSESEKIQFQYVIQLSLSNIGNKAIAKKYSKRLKELKKMKKSISTVNFKIDPQYYQDSKIQAQEIVDRINEILVQREQRIQQMEKEREKNKTLENEPKESENEYESISIIPFFDILYQNLIQTKLDIEQNILDKNKQFWEAMGYTPQMISESKIMDQEFFLNILSFVPEFLKFSNWEILFSTQSHGSSLESLYRYCENEFPLIVVIKDYSGNIFGAYCSDSLKKGFTFYGNGDCFLFTKQEGKFLHYGSTGKNQDFLMCSKDGFGIGCGEKYGLFVQEGLDHGATYPCSTFDNLSLCLENTFSIESLEIWVKTE